MVGQKFLATVERLCADMGHDIFDDTAECRIPLREDEGEQLVLHVWRSGKRITVQLRNRQTSDVELQAVYCFMGVQSGFRLITFTNANQTIDLVEFEEQTNRITSVDGSAATQHRIANQLFDWERVITYRYAGALQPAGDSR